MEPAFPCDVAALQDGNQENCVDQRCAKFSVFAIQINSNHSHLWSNQINSPQPIMPKLINSNQWFEMFCKSIKRKSHQLHRIGGGKFHTCLRKKEVASSLRNILNIRLFANQSIRITGDLSHVGKICGKLFNMRATFNHIDALRWTKSSAVILCRGSLRTMYS